MLKLKRIMRSYNRSILFVFFILFSLTALKAGDDPCSATIYQLSDFGIERTYTLDNGTYNGIADPACGDYQGQDFWVEFIGPNSGLLNIELLDGSITDAAFEVYWNACDGLAQSVGCFSDRNCGTIDMPAANLEVIPGETYHVRIFQEGGGGGTLGFRMSDIGGSQFTLGGDAEPYDSGNPAETCFRLTEANNNETGCAWFDTPIDFSAGFEINYSLFLGDSDAGAEGVAFVFHTETNPSCDNNGNGVGMLDLQGGAFVVEFDTNNNGGGLFGSDISEDHVAVRLDNGPFGLTLAGPESLETNGNVEDGAFHDVKLIWDPNSNQFQVFFDGNLMISTNIGVVINLFGNGNEVFWGVTGATGSGSEVNEQIFCFDGFRLENSGSVEVDREEIICEGEAIIFDGQPILDEDEYIGTFMAANGCDSIVTLNLIHATLEITGDTEISLGCDAGQVSEMLEPIVTSNADASELSFEWDTDDGSFESGENTLTPIVNAAGTYTLTVKINEIGCEEEFIIEVKEVELPFISVEGGFIGCPGSEDSTIVITCDFDGEYDVQWSTNNGNAIGPTNSPMLEVDTVGNYSVTVTDPLTGCSNTAEVEVSAVGGIVEESLNSVPYCQYGQWDLYAGNQVRLEAELEGEVISFEWSPAEYVSDPFSLNPYVFPDGSLEQVFTLSYKTPSGQNLVQNGSFAFGDTLFTSDYIEGNSSTGEYLITDNPTDFSAQFSDCDDNSSTDSQMMVVDGHTQAGQNIWCQEVEIEEGTSYYFTARATNLCSSCGSNFPLLSMTINGDEVNTPFLLDTPDCEWSQISHDPLSNQSQCWVGLGTVAELCITNLETSAAGNDFAIDDIGFYFVCEGGVGECGVYQLPDTDVFIEPVEIGCQPDGVVDLVATAEGGNTFVTFDWYFWSQDASSMTPLDGGENGTISVQDPGDYYATLIDKSTGCLTFAGIFLEISDMDFPVFSVFDGDVLNCINPSTSIGVNGLDNSDYSFEWTSNGVSIGTSTSSLSVASGGQYEVLITNLVNTCTETQSFFVDENFEIPDIVISPVPTLNCNQVGQSITLDVTSSSSFPSIIYDWSSQGGEILSGEGSQSPEILGAGIYFVTITDLDSGCENVESIVIEENTATPNASATAPNTLDCDNPQGQITIDGSGLDYQWSSNPNIISALDGNIISITDAGVYDVLVTDPNTGCDTTISVTVNADFDEPNVEAGIEQTFTCINSTLSLTGSSSDNIVDIRWQTAGGLITGGGDTFTPDIGGAGIYTIVVTGQNGCTAEDSVTILADADIPVIAQIPTLNIDCIETSVEIDATNSSSGPEFDFEWRDENGNIIADFTSLNPTVSEAGQYQLTILNAGNGCEAQTIVSVVDNSVDPDGIPTSVSPLNCGDLSSTFGLVTANPDWTFIWSDANGIITNEDDFQLETAEEGEYNLIVTNQSNGCTSQYSFNLPSEISMPSLIFEGSATLSCGDPNVQIGVMTDASNPSFSWQTDDGNIVQSSVESSIQVNMAGTYTVTITDGLTGCTVEDVVNITNDNSAPIIDIPNVDDLTCVVDEITLFSDVSNIGGDVEYLWSTTDGILASPNGGSNITAGAPGIYVLTVVNNENGCSANSSVLVEELFNSFIIDIDTPDMLNCNVAEIILSAQDVGVSNVEYLWSTADGSILSGADGLDPTVSQEGEYTLTVTDVQTGCTSSSSVFVEQDGALPNIDIAPFGMLNCDIFELTIDASASTQGLDVLTVWSTSDGNIVSGENTLMPVVDMAGEYLLTITNIANNCETTQLITLESNQITPEVDFGPLEDIKCGSSSVVINANITNGVSNLAYEWIALNGNIVGGTTASSIEVDAEGTYELLVTNLDNMCSNVFNVDIGASVEVPDVTLNTPNNIDCTNQTSTLSVEFPMGNPNLTFAWSTDNGQFDGDINSSEILATAEGNYTVVVTDTESNCETVLSVFIQSNMAAPQLDFIVPDTITCFNMQSVINTQTDQNGLIYEWTTLDGAISSVNNGEDVVVESAGTYTLLVRDPANDCTNVIQVEVIEDVEFPNVEIEPALILNCIIEEQSLSGDGSSMGSEFSYAWSTSLGAIVSGGNTLNPLISGSGYYVLEITNNENNCVFSDSVLVTENVVQPLANITQPEKIDCVDEIITLSTDIPPGTDLTFVWLTDNGNIISDPNLNTIEVDEVGEYQLLLEDNQTGCENILSVEVFSDKEEPILELSPGFTLNCNQEDGLLSTVDVDPNVELNWFDPQGNMIAATNSVAVNMPGLYTAIAISSINGCETLREVEVLINDNMPTDLIVDILSPDCAGENGSIQLQEVVGGEGPYLYSTDNGQTFRDITDVENLSSGTTSTVIVMDTNGCEYSEAFEIPSVLPVSVVLPAGMDLFLGERLQLQVETNIVEADIDQIIWTPNTGLSCVDCLNPTVTPNSSIEYQVEVVNLNGCSDFATIQLRVESDQSIYIPNAFTPFNQDGFNDTFYLFAKPGVVTKVLSMQIYDRWGNQVFLNENFNANEETSGWDGRFNNEKVHLGVYVYFAVVEYRDGSRELLKGDVTLVE